MSEKNWICPCNGCKKARNTALLEIKEIANKYLYDAPFALHMIFEHIRNETGTKKKNEL